jgi:hypothetical protein
VITHSRRAGQGENRLILRKVLPIAAKDQENPLIGAQAKGVVG